uniref:Pectinesterase inhibitor domain-containing protein n=1 Tax=Glossina brevipalpis TaxID=37001 RepID=A0A1A9W5T4_9MUSC
MLCKFMAIVTFSLSIYSVIFGESVDLTGTAASRAITAINITTNPGNITIEEALEYSKVTIEIIEDFINDDLAAVAKSEGYEILENVRDGLNFCESELKTTEDIWSYKICTNALLRNGLAALAALQNQYSSKPPTTSGAGRMKLFW